MADLLKNPVEKPGLRLYIPTTSGTGAEVTHISVLTIEEDNHKIGFRTSYTYPTVAVVILRRACRRTSLFSQVLMPHPCYEAYTANGQSAADVKPSGPSAGWQVSADRVEGQEPEAGMAWPAPWPA